MTKQSLTLYTREKCPLCVTAKSLLDDFSKETGISYREIDIYSNDKLIEEYGLMIPVLKWKEDIIQYGKIDSEALYGLLKN